MWLCWLQIDCIYNWAVASTVNWITWWNFQSFFVHFHHSKYDNVPCDSHATRKCYGFSLQINVSHSYARRSTVKLLNRLQNQLWYSVRYCGVCADGTYFSPNSMQIQTKSQSTRYHCWESLLSTSWIQRKLITIK